MLAGSWKFDPFQPLVPIERVQNTVCNNSEGSLRVVPHRSRSSPGPCRRALRRSHRRGGQVPRGAVTAFGATGLLGLTVSTEFGGAGLGLPEAADVVARTARVCPATAAVLRSHYAAVAVIESYGNPWVRGEIAAGRHLGSLALIEDDTGGEQETEAQLLMPHCTAVRSGGVVALRARKCRVVAAGEADSYVWSSRPLGMPDGLSLWGFRRTRLTCTCRLAPTPRGRRAAPRPQCSPTRCWCPRTPGSVRTGVGATLCWARSCRGCSNWGPQPVRGRTISRPPTLSRRPELQPAEGPFRCFSDCQSWPAPAAICLR